MKNNKLLIAVKNLYLAGKWECKSLSSEKQDKLWKDLRDSANIKIGTATKLNISSKD